MYKTIQAFKDAISAETVASSALITLPDNTVLSDDELTELKITDKCYDDGKLIGTAMSKELEVKIINDNYDLADKDIKLEVGVELPYDTESATTTKSNTFHLTDSAEGVCEDAEIFGESTQAVREGYNLIQYSDSFNSNASNATGITSSITTEGYLQYDVESTNGNYSTNWWNPNNYSNVVEEALSEGDTFTILFTIKRTSGSTGKPTIYIKSGMGYYTMTGNVGTDFSGIYYTGTWKDDNPIAYHLGFGSCSGTFVIKNWMIKKGEYKPYEQYGVSPSLDYPSEIYSITSPVQIISAGKNLLPKDIYTSTKNEVTFTVNSDGSIHIQGTTTARTLFNINLNKPITLKDNTSYVLSKEGDNQYVEIYLRKRAKSELIASIGATGTYKKFTNTYTEPVFAYIAISAGITLDITLKLQLEEGTESTDYEPYISTQTYIPLPHQLRSLTNEINDRIYKGADGKWYDEQNIASITLNGTETDWVYNANQDKTNTVFFQKGIANRSLSYGTGSVPLLCDKLINRQVWNIDQEGILLQSNNGILMVRINKSRLSGTIGVEAFKEWLISNNLNIQYEINTPITTEIIDESTIEALESIYTYDNITNITSDAPIKLTYLKKIEGTSIKYIPYGNYIVKSYTDTKSNNRYKIVAYDYMDKLNVEFVDNNTYPITLKTFYENLATQYNVGIESQETLPNESFLIETKPAFEKQSGRTVLGRIAEMFGSYAKINRDNKIQMYLKTETNEKISLENMNSNLVIDKKYGPVNTVVLKQSVFEGENVSKEDSSSVSENGVTELTIEDNPFIWSEELRDKAILEIFNRVNGFEYIPTEYTYKSFLYFDSGDTVQVQNMDDNYVKTIILNQSIQIPATRKSTVKSPAPTKTETKNKFYSEERQSQKHTEALVKKHEGEIELITEEQTEQGTNITQILENLSGITSSVTSLDANLEELKSTTKQTNEALEFVISKSNGNNLVKNSDMANNTEFWQAHLKAAFIESDVPPENPNDGDFWYCTSAYDIYEANQMYKYTTNSWQKSDLTRKILNNTINLLEYTTSYENDDSKLNTASGRYIRVDVTNDYPEATHSYNATNIIPMDSNEEYITVSLKIKNNIKLGNIMLVLGFLPDFELPAAENPSSLYEPSILLTPDEYSNTLKQYSMTVKIPNKSEYIPVVTGTTPPTDTTKYWLYELKAGIGVVMKYDGTNWVQHQTTGVIYEEDTKLVWTYRALYGAYYKTNFTSDLEFKSIICIVAFYGGFALTSSTTAPTPQKGLYWLDTTNNKCFRAKYINDEFNSWEDTGLTATWVSQNIMPVANMPFVPPKGYFEFSDLKVEWNSMATRWNRYQGEIYSKNFKADENGLAISSGSNKMLIDEDEIIATYNNINIFGINKDLCFTRRFKAEQEISLGDFRWYLAQIDGNTQMLFN